MKIKRKKPIPQIIVSLYADMQGNFYVIWLDQYKSKHESKHESHHSAGMKILKKIGLIYPKKIDETN